jgi:hypothetical protein
MVLFTVLLPPEHSSSSPGIQIREQPEKGMKAWPNFSRRVRAGGTQDVQVSPARVPDRR